MDDKTKKAFDFAADSTKQLITLSTGMIALTITFKKEIIRGDLTTGAKCVLSGAWFAYAMAIIFGLWTLLALTGTLDQVDGSAPISVSIRGENVTGPSK